MIWKLSCIFFLICFTSFMATAFSVLRGIPWCLLLIVVTHFLSSRRNGSLTGMRELHVCIYMMYGIYYIHSHTMISLGREILAGMSKTMTKGFFK